MRRLFWSVFCVVLLGLFPAYAASAVTIRIHNGVFEPNEVTLTTGTTVIFQNDDQVDRWPASDPHPIHDDYPGFDPNRPIAHGKTWSFTVEASGTWRYHDHLNPGSRGTLIVTEDAGPTLRNIFIEPLRKSLKRIKEKFWSWVPPGVYRWKYGFRFKHANEDIDVYILSQMKLCYPFGARHECYRQITELFLKQFNTKQIFESFKRSETKPEVFSRCHEVGHYIGRKIYETTNDLSYAYGQCEVMVCGVGCYHGAAESYFRDQQLSLNDTNERISAKVLAACGNEKDYEKQIVYHECLHGLGHGLMALTDMEVPRSLKLCDAFPSAWDQEGCYAGVFMENATSLTVLDHTAKYLRKDDPLYPCNILDSHYQKLCYEYQATYFGSLTNWRLEDTVALCQKIPLEHQDVCFNQIAAYKAMMTQDVLEMKQACDYLPNTRRKDKCVETVVSTLGGRYIDEPNFMIQFCALVSESNKKVCYSQLGGMILYWGNNTTVKKDTICETLPTKQYIQWCKAAKPDNASFVGS